MPGQFFLNSIKATPSACEADMRVSAAVNVYLSNIIQSGPLPRQCRPFFSTIEAVAFATRSIWGCYSSIPRRMGTPERQILLF